MEYRSSNSQTVQLFGYTCFVGRYQSQPKRRSDQTLFDLLYHDDIVHGTEKTRRQMRQTNYDLVVLLITFPSFDKSIGEGNGFLRYQIHFAKRNEIMES
jgi:hypothetical protein